MVKVLRETEKVDVVIALSHGGVEKGEDGRYGDGDDVRVAIAPQDLPNTFTDIAAGTPLANLCTDAFRKATKADIGFTANGMMRAGLTRGKSGVQTVYDVFAVAPLGAGVVDSTAGSALVTGYFHGLELKNLLEFLLVDSPAHPGEYFPRASGMRFHYDLSRPKFDVVTAIELGDLDRGYTPIDITGQEEKLYSLTCPLMLGPIIVAIPKYTKGKLPLVPKNKAGQPLTSRIEALIAPRESSGYLLPPKGTVDKGSVATVAERGEVREIKEWQAIMDHLRSLPVKSAGELPTIPVDERAAEVRAIKVG
jgi:5'-nucleotidase